MQKIVRIIIVVALMAPASRGQAEVDWLAYDEFERRAIMRSLPCSELIRFIDAEEEFGLFSQFYFTHFRLFSQFGWEANKRAYENGKLVELCRENPEMTIGDGIDRAKSLYAQ